MRVHLHNTTRIVELDLGLAVDKATGRVPARVWEGVTDGGVPVIAFITRIAAERDSDLTEFERDLSEVTPPSADVAMWPGRMFID